MGLLNIASVPAAAVSPDTTVLSAVELMNRQRVGAVAIVEGGKLSGIFTERDVMNRVVLTGRDPRTTPVSEVMTADVEAVSPEMSSGEALRIMVDRHFRHLPVVDAERGVLGLLSVRDLLQHAVEELSHELDSVVNFYSADGPGG
jgi:CBS domain-containing protein